MLPLPEVLVDPSSLSSQHQLQIQIPPSIQPLITPHTFFLLNKSDLVTDILPPALSTTSFSISHQSTYPTNVLHLLPMESNALPSTPTSPVEMQNSNTSESPYHGQAWSTSLVTNQGTHEFVQGLAEALKSRYDIFPRRYLESLFFQLFLKNLFRLDSTLTTKPRTKYMLHL